MRSRSIVTFALLAVAACAAPVEPSRSGAPPTPPVATALVALAAPHAEGRIDLAESVPLETTLDHPEIPDAYQVWPEMIQGAVRTLDIAEFYLSNAPDSRLEPVIRAIEAAADRGVAVRLLVDASFAGHYPETIDCLAARRGVTVRRFDVGKVMGGILHAKYFVVDGRDAYVGSQNFDWRSLTHIQEMGVRVRDPGAAADYAAVFSMDWALAAGEPPPAPASGPEAFPESFAGRDVVVTPVFSPKGFLPDPRSWELPRIVALIDGARRSVHVQVLTYKTAARDGSPFPDLDDALRRAAARGVEVQLLVSDWDKKKGTVESVQSLARVSGVTARFIDIPAWSGGFVPFARVAHAKYMVVDGARAWVGSSNWEGDYFTRSRNAGVVVDGEAFAGQLERVFQGGFAGRYAETVDPDKKYEPPRVSER